MAHKLTPDELEKKRIRDRRSQHAMRERTKGTISELQAQVLAFQEREKLLCEENESLRDENENLKLRLQNSPAVGRMPTLGDLMASSGVFEVLCNDPISPVDIPQSRVGAHEAIPLNCPPTCLSDRMLEDFVQMQRFELNQKQESSPSPVQKPDISGLLDNRTSARSSLDEQPRSVSTVVSDILRSFSEIDTLPRRIAALYLMHKMLNIYKDKWTIYRTEQTFDQIPSWLRPHSLQLTHPHASWIDRIPWPNARIHLISHPEITFDDFAGVYSSSFDVSWPYSSSLVLISKSPGGGAVGPTNGSDINPVFDQHLGRLSNWSVGEAFKRKFPDLSYVIEQDCKDARIN